MGKEALQTLVNKIVSALPGLCGRLIAAALVLVIGFKLVNFFAKKIKDSKRFQQLEDTAEMFIYGLIRILGKIFVVVTVIAILGIPTSSVVAVIGSAGLAIGLALQGSLSNFAGGIMLLIFKPCAVGDYITTDDASGTVSAVGIFYTSLITPDNKRIVVPNSLLSNKTITNYSVKDTRRVEFKLQAKYDCDIDKVKSVINKVASSHELVLKDPAPFVRLSAQQESSLEFVCRVWVKSGDYWTVHFDLTEQFRKELDANGIEAPFNTITIAQ